MEDLQPITEDEARRLSDEELRALYFRGFANLTRLEAERALALARQSALYRELERRFRSPLTERYGEHLEQALLSFR